MREIICQLQQEYRLIGCSDVDRIVGIEGWTPDRKVVKFIAELKNEGRL